MPPGTRIRVHLVPPPAVTLRLVRPGLRTHRSLRGQNLWHQLKRWAHVVGDQCVASPQLPAASCVHWCTREISLWGMCVPMPPSHVPSSRSPGGGSQGIKDPPLSQGTSDRRGSNMRASVLGSRWGNRLGLVSRRTAVDVDQALVRLCVYVPYCTCVLVCVILFVYVSAQVSRPNRRCFSPSTALDDEAKGGW